MQIDRKVVEQALEALEERYVGALRYKAMDALMDALAQPEDKSQAAFEHWVDTVEATQGCAISRNAVADATCKQDLQVEPCNKSCAPGYCYCEPIIKPEIKADKETRWLPMPWKGLTEEEHNYYKALGFVGVKAVEEKLRAKNSTLVPS